MNLMEISSTITSLGHWLSGGLICSLTVNILAMTFVLLGAVWFLMPFEPGRLLFQRLPIRFRRRQGR
ncbi:MAG: hypothetical protein AB7D39_10090 [Pseudodesulfovibrio sp.]|uniref:hypothetical protein n=1 Tax=Pseudodesulfovibrio sp. TaxID=2035812 RepID=UPI003D0DD31A